MKVLSDAGPSTTEQTRFVVSIGSSQGERHCHLLIESLRAFGGRLGGCPVWVFAPDDQGAPGTFHSMPNVHCLPLHIEDELRHYPLGDKVCACARAEELAGPEVRSLVWLSPHCLVLQEPVLFDLASCFEAAFRPVHIRNVGSPASERPDAFWRGVYETVGLDEPTFAVESFVDVQRLRPYFNTHVFSIDPSKRLLRSWLQHFRALVCDQQFQLQHCSDETHQIFLHQAVLSALLAKCVDEKRLRLLPAEYSYPLHLHWRVPAARRPDSLNALVCAVYEETFRYPETLQGLEALEPLRSWLMERTAGSV